MRIGTLQELFDELVRARTSDQVRDALDGIGDHAEVELEESFGDLSFQWRAFGGSQSNISTIGLGTKPGRSLTERLTNADDALLEDRVVPGVNPPNTPREAAKQWFGRPITGPDDGLFKWDYSAQSVDRRVAVILLQSGVAAAPTVDVLDTGIGIAPEAFPSTILSLQHGNKINKRHLMGAFGQGGSASLAFADYAFIVSRHRDHPGRVGFTIVRVLNLSENYKEDCYGYLTVKQTDGTFAVPSVMLDDPLDLYQAEAGTKSYVLAKGTLVRHFAYKLPGLEKTLSPSPGNLYTFLHTSMFDPLFPFRVVDLREPDRAKDELVTGSRNKLMKLQTQKDTLTEPDTGLEGDPDRGSRIAHYRPMEYIAPFGSTDLSIGIEYWVVLNYRKKKNKATGKDDVVLRASSNELYVQPSHPIVGTLNGQNQGELSAQLLKELNLGMVSRHIVVHIDATKSNSKVRRELFSTSREGFKDGTTLTELTRVLKEMFAEDKNLFAIERTLTESLAKRDAQETNAQVKKLVTRLLTEAGLELKEEGVALEPGEGEPTAVKRKKRGGYRAAAPLPTLPFPQATKLAITWPRPSMEIHLQDVESVLVETDADSEFDRRGLVAIRSEPPVLEIAGKAPLSGGRIRWRLRPVAKVEAGHQGKIVVTLTKPDGTQLTDSVDFVLLPPLEEKSQQTKGFVPPFEIVPIDPDHIEEWSAAWPTLSGDEVEPKELAAVAYKSVRARGKIWVYYSTIFAPFAEQVNKLKTDASGLSELFRNNYEAWIAYHAILQDAAQQGAKMAMDPDEMDAAREEERCRVARMEVKQALNMAKLQHDALKREGDKDVG